MHESYRLHGHAYAHAHDHVEPPLLRSHPRPLHPLHRRAPLRRFGDN